jgi:DNA-binding response OmpR family regulator
VTRQLLLRASASEARLARILLAEADASVRIALGAMLEAQRHAVVRATTPLQLASALDTEVVDLAIVDLALLRTDAVTAELRRLPVIAISPSDPAPEPDLAFESKLHRPLDLAAAGVFVAAALSTVAVVAQGSDELEAPDGVRIRPAVGRVYVRGFPVHLTPLELRLFTLLVRRRGRTQSIERLARDVWGHEAQGRRNFVEARVSSIRRKLRALGAYDVIETVRSVGYRVPCAVYSEDGRVEDSCTMDRRRVDARRAGG